MGKYGEGSLSLATLGSPMKAPSRPRGPSFRDRETRAHLLYPIPRLHSKDTPTTKFAAARQLGERVRGNSQKSPGVLQTGRQGGFVGKQESA